MRRPASSSGCCAAGCSPWLRAPLTGAARFGELTLPFADALRPVPIIGPLYADVISGHSILVYLAFGIVALTWWVLYRTRYGLRLRAVGENPAAVDTAGVSVIGLRFAATHLLSLAFFPAWFSRVEQTLGPRTVQMYSNNLEACEDLMLQRSVQFLLSYGHPSVPGRLEESGHPMHPIGEETLLPVAAAAPDGSPAFRLGAAAAEELPILAYHASSGLGRMLQACLRPLLSHCKSKMSSLRPVDVRPILPKATPS